VNNTIRNETNSCYSVYNITILASFVYIYFGGTTAKYHCTHP